MHVLPERSKSPAHSPLPTEQTSKIELPAALRVRNRRKRYLDLHPEYFESPSLELVDPLLYDRLIRRFQTAAEREADGRRKGYSGILQADILRSEAKIDALANPDPSLAISYRRGADGEILEEEKDEVPLTKEEGRDRWYELMRWRFLRGDDGDFEYGGVDGSEAFDDLVQQRRDEEDEYFDGEEPVWVVDGKDEAKEEVPMSLTGETGVQDF